MKRETTTFKPEIGPVSSKHFAPARCNRLRHYHVAQKPSAPHTLVAVDYCPNLKEVVPWIARFTVHQTGHHVCHA